MTEERITLYISGHKLHGKKALFNIGEEYSFEFHRKFRRFNCLSFLKNTAHEYSKLGPGPLALIKISLSRVLSLIKQNGYRKTLVHFFPYKVTIRIQNEGFIRPHTISMVGDAREVWTSRLAVISGFAPYALNHSQEYDFARFQSNFSAFIWDSHNSSQKPKKSPILKQCALKPLLKGSSVSLYSNLKTGVLTFHNLSNAKIIHARTVLCENEVYPSDLHNYTDGSWPTDSIYVKDEVNYYFNHVTQETEFAGCYIFLGSSTSWFHFLIEVFPRYILFSSEMLKSCIPVVENKTPIQILQVLSLISKNQPVTISPGEVAKFQTLHTSTESRFPLGLDLLNRRSDILLVREYFQTKMNLTSKIGYRLILIKRNRKLFRYSADVEMLEEFCRGIGFEIVDTGNLSMKQQVELFASAKVVIGETGSSLTNLLFCNPETLVIELNLHNFMPGFFSDFCEVLGVNHIVADCVFATGGRIELSVKGVRREIRELLQIYS